MGDRGLEAIADTLLRHSTLTFLDVSANALGAHSGRWLGRVPAHALTHWWAALCGRAALYCTAHDVARGNAMTVDRMGYGRGRIDLDSSCNRLISRTTPNDRMGYRRGRTDEHYV